MDNKKFEEIIYLYLFYQINVHMILKRMDLLHWQQLHSKVALKWENVALNWPNPILNIPERLIRLFFGWTDSTWLDHWLPRLPKHANGWDNLGDVGMRRHGGHWSKDAWSWPRHEDVQEDQVVRLQQHLLRPRCLLEAWQNLRLWLCLQLEEEQFYKQNKIGNLKIHVLYISSMILIKE